VQIFLHGADNATVSPAWSAADDCFPVCCRKAGFSDRFSEVKHGCDALDA